MLLFEFCDRMISENAQVVRAAMQRGEFITDAAAEAYRAKGARSLGSRCS